MDEFLGGLATAWPGVRHIVVHDTAQAAEHFAGLTRALAEQPFRAEVSLTPKPSAFGSYLHDILGIAPSAKNDTFV